MGPVGITRSARAYNFLKPNEKGSARLVPWYVQFEDPESGESTTAAECPVRNCVFVDSEGEVECGSQSQCENLGEVYLGNIAESSWATIAMAIGVCVFVVAITRFCVGPAAGEEEFLDKYCFCCSSPEIRERRKKEAAQKADEKKQQGEKKKSSSA